VKIIKKILFLVAFSIIDGASAYIEIQCKYTSKEKINKAPFELIIDNDRNRIYDATAQYLLEVDGYEYSAHQIWKFQTLEELQLAEKGIIVGSKPVFSITRSSLNFYEGKDRASCKILNPMKTRI